VAALEEEKYGESNQNGSEGKAEDCDDRFYQSRAFQCPGGASSFGLLEQREFLFQ
jgi:hypothetical protein